jgi:MFS family permease
MKRFSPKFWVLMAASFIDNLGSTMVFPFFALYLTQKFGVGLAQAGALMGIYSITGFVGSMIGGALADRYGRRKIILIGLVLSALSSISFGVVNKFAVFYVLAVVVGIPSRMARPAFSAMVADLLPEEQRTEGYGIHRVVFNLAYIIGPVIGGLLITYSYLSIFIADAIASLIVAWIFFKIMSETKPQQDSTEALEPLNETFLGYFKVARDGLLVFVIGMIFETFGYQRIFSTLPVYLHDVHAIPESGFGYLMSVNDLLVVLFQFWVTSKVGKRKPMHLMALGNFLFMIGLMMYGLVSSYALFMLAMVIITVGEMLVAPVAQAMTARFAPEQMRSRYMAFFSLTGRLPAAIGPWAAGLVFDNYAKPPGKPTTT